MVRKRAASRSGNSTPKPTATGPPESVVSAASSSAKHATQNGGGGGAAAAAAAAAGPGSQNELAAKQVCAGRRNVVSCRLCLCVVCVPCVWFVYRVCGLSTVCVCVCVCVCISRVRKVVQI